jgi:hypothetical protein
MATLFLSPRDFLFSSRDAAGKMLPRTSRKLLCALLLCALTALASAPGYAVTSTAKSHRHAAVPIHPAVYSRFHWRLSKWNPMFKGSHDLLVQQNQELDQAQLPRIFDDNELIRMELAQDLVPVSETDALKISSELPDTRRYCRPWTRDFLQNFSQAFYTEFHTPIQVNSLVRTVQQQQRLRRHNRFAAPEWGDTASTHLTGVTFDMSRRGLTPQQYAWILSYLLPLKEGGMVDPIEESQPVLHVVVFEKYSGGGDDNKGWSEANEPTDMSLQSAGGSQP